MKQVLPLILCFLLVSGLNAQEKAQRSPLNPEFTKYIDYQKSNPEKKNSGGYATGYVPSPMYLHFNTVQLAEEGKKSMEALPSYYNLKDFGWVTPVRNQGPAGACWSFSTMGAIESRWLKLGIGTPATLDLSEQNMATCHGFQAGINDGGSDYIAAAYLSRLSGPVTEASDPYNPVATASCKEKGLILPAYSPQTIWLPKDINIIKKAIMDYGAVTASIFVGQLDKYYNTSDKTFYYDGTSPVDHGVLVIGWDNNLVVNGNLVKPKSKGAWIVKNSWGTTWGDQGYFYVSYEDSRFLSSCSYYPERIEKTAIDTMFMYDWLGATQSFGFRADSASAVAKFDAPQKMFINKIGTFVNASGSVIDIDIYKEFSNDSIPGQLVASSRNNFCKFPGYYTFDIPAVVEGSYYVKVKYKTPGYNYPIPVEAAISYQGVPYAIPVLEPAGRFWISSDEEEWLPLGNDVKDYEADLSIRIYADRNTSLNPFFTANKTVSCVNGDVTFTSSSNGTVNSYQWDFGAGASPATANTAGPHNVTYSTTGLKTISLTITGPDGSRTLIKNSYIDVVTALDIFLPYSEKILIKGKSIPLVAFGADTYSWSPSNGLNSNSGSNVMASPTESITYTVTGSMGTCTGSASVKINVVVGPSNDDVCHAIQLTGYGVYNNIYATSQDGEPAPPEGDCNTPLQWCVEGGLQNSVWFWFIAPAGGKVSFTTKGMDTQIAIYKAENCDSIVSGSFDMIAANDDYFPEAQFFAAALSMVDVVPGQKYYVQIDGSAGGDEGSFELIYDEWPVSTEDMNISEKFSIYPNPSNGTFRFLYDSGITEKVNIRIYNFSGKEIYSRNYNSTGLPLDEQIRLSDMAPGVYMFELASGHQVLHKNLVIK
jgi:C1A family cysteine protease/PKD repeat protein